MFELHITCTKDISKINIDFTDGTSTVCGAEGISKTENPENPKNPKSSKGLSKEFRETREPKEPREPKKVDIPDWESYNAKPTFESIKPPEIPEVQRQPKIDDVLNNFEI